MVGRPRIGVTRWENVRGERMESYWERLRELDLEPIDLFEPGQSLDGCAGLVLSGGVDIDPQLYGEEPQHEVQQCLRARDDFELGLLRGAFNRTLPVLAICRGHQLLNVALGGRLLQHVERHSASDEEGHPSRRHEVGLDAASRLARILGTERLTVNSRHHQAVTPDRLAPGLRATGLSADGLVEAVESERHAWVIGVQWHPEREEPAMPGFRETSAKLFQAFAAAVEVRRD